MEIDDDDRIDFEEKLVDYFKGELNKLLDKDLTVSPNIGVNL